MNTDRQLPDGSIERTDPRTGRTRIVSAADAGRTALTRERDAELSMQAGAPPIAKGPVAGSQPQAQQPAAPAKPAAALATPQPSSGAAPASPAPKAPAAPKIPEPTAATNPNLPASFDLPMRNIAVAAGPNISTAPSGLPEGSAGYQRKDGRYTVRTADGQTRDFANEAEAIAAFPRPTVAPASAAGTPGAASSRSTASAANTAAANPSQARTAAPSAPAAEMAPVYTMKGIGQRAGQAASFAATDQTEANPFNFIDTAERYGAATVGALWDGRWSVPEKGLIRQGMEAALERDAFTRNIGSAIGDAQAQARQKEAIAAGRIAPNFNERAERAAARYRRGPNGEPSLAEMEASASPVAPVAAQPNGAPTFQQMRAEAVPVAPVSPAVQAVVAAATRPPQPTATPTNEAPPLLRRRAPQFLPPKVEPLTFSDPGAFPPLLRSATGSRPLANITAFR